MHCRRHLPQTQSGCRSHRSFSSSPCYSSLVLRCCTRSLVVRHIPVRGSYREDSWGQSDHTLSLHRRRSRVRIAIRSSESFRLVSDGFCISTLMSYAAPPSKTPSSVRSEGGTALLTPEPKDKVCATALISDSATGGAARCVRRARIRAEDKVLSLIAPHRCSGKGHLIHCHLMW